MKGLRLSRLLPAFLLLGFFAPVAARMSAGPAEAASPPPVIDSWYVASNWYNTYNTGGGHSVWYNFGYNAKDGGDVDLDFGQPCYVSGSGWGLSSWEFGCQSYTTVEANLTSVESGYDANPDHTDTRILDVGINDSVDESSWNWDNVGTSIAQILDQVGDGGKISPVGRVRRRAPVVI